MTSHKFDPKLTKVPKSPHNFSNSLKILITFHSSCYALSLANPDEPKLNLRYMFKLNITVGT